MSRDLIPVCAKCLRASCWQGIWLCEESKAAGIVHVPMAELDSLALEDKSYLKSDDQLCAEANASARSSRG